jgi:hypothetical protein
MMTTMNSDDFTPAGTDVGSYVTNAVKLRRLTAAIERAGAAFSAIASNAAYAVDALEGLNHEVHHRVDGPAGQPCGRCADLLDAAEERCAP